MSIERKRYLEICRENSIYNKSKYVWYKGVKYYPCQYILWFDESGNTRHSAFMNSETGKSTLRCNLAYVDESVYKNFK